MCNECNWPDIKKEEKNMDEIRDIIDHIAEKAWKEIQKEEKSNSDNSHLNEENIEETLKIISKCEYFIDLLLTQTESYGGFGSYYPKECMKHMKIMRKILEMEKK